MLNNSQPKGSVLKTSVRRRQIGQIGLMVLTLFGLSGCLETPLIQSVRFGGAEYTLHGGRFATLMYWPKDDGTELTVPESVMSEGRTYTVTAIGERAFAFSEDLETVVIPDTVAEIGRQAFAGCRNLTSVEIPASVTRIGDGAFGNCVSLTEIALPNSVTHIGYEAFAWCESLAAIDLPDYLSFLGEGAFSNCTSLTSVELPDSLSEIEERLFQNCTSLVSVTLPQDVQNIWNGAFAGCESLTEINLPDSLGIVGDSVFAGCKSLETIDIPESVTIIGKSAFEECELLETVSIPESVSAVNDRTFAGCSLLTGVIFDGDQVMLGEDVFAGTPLEYHSELQPGLIIEKLSFSAEIREEDHLIYTVYPFAEERPYAVLTGWEPGIEEHLDIPGRMTDTIPVTGIGRFAFQPDQSGFQEESGLLSVTVPASVTEIGDGAFAHCDSLQSVTIKPGNYELNIGAGVLDGCRSLTEISTERKLITVDESFPAGTPFFRHSELSGEEIAAGVYRAEPLVKDRVQYVLYSYVLSDGKTEDQYAVALGFETLPEPEPGTEVPEPLTELNFPAELSGSDISAVLTEIADNAFEGNDFLETVILPGSLERIGIHAFSGNSALTSVILSDSVREIARDAFAFCTSLEEISIPESVDLLGDDVFHGCEALISVTFDGDRTTLGVEVFGQTPLQELTALERGETPQSGIYTPPEETESNPASEV